MSKTSTDNKHVSGWITDDNCDTISAEIITKLRRELDEANARAAKLETTAAAHVAGWTKQCEVANAAIFRAKKAEHNIVILQILLEEARRKVFSYAEMRERDGWDVADERNLILHIDAVLKEKVK